VAEREWLDYVATLIPPHTFICRRQDGSVEEQSKRRKESSKQSKKETNDHAPLKKNVVLKGKT
jgi:hypothetical protein